MPARRLVTAGAGAGVPIHRRGREAWTALLVVAAVAFLVADRAELPRALRVLRGADVRWVGVAVGCAVTWSIVYALLHRATQQAAGLRPAPLTALFPAALAAHFLNLTTKSGAMAGLVVLRRLGRRRDQSPGGIVVAYVVAALLSELAFAVALALGLGVVAADGRLSGTDIVAGSVFALYLVLRVGLALAAVGRRERTRRLVAAPGAWWARLRRRPRPEPDHERADELHDALHLIRRRPAAVAPAVGAALGLEAIGIALLWSVLAAVGAPHTAEVAVVGYAISVLFAIVGFLPGGLGFVEASLGTVLVSFGATTASAAAAVTLYRLFELWLPAAIGAATARHLRRRGVTG